MKIDSTLLSEKNYTGNRRILVEDEKLKEFQTILEGYQKDINPLLDRMNVEYSPIVDPLNAEIQKKTLEIKELKARITAETDKFQDVIDGIEKAEQKAQLIKNKVQPIVLKALEGKLSEFEVARYTEVDGGKIYAVVFDELEEKVKEIRANNGKK